MIDAALDYASGGWFVFPLRDKRPLTPNGHLAATTDHALIREWWRVLRPNGIGIATEPSNLCVIDLDSRDAVEPIRHLLCPTLTSCTRTNRWQAYYWIPPDVRIRRQIGRWPHVDICAASGYVVAPPSIHPETGRPYRWVRDMAPARLPLELQELLVNVLPFPERRERTDGSVNIEAIVRFVLERGEGERNRALFWAACRIVEAGADEAPLIDAARAIGLEDAEIMRTIGSAHRQTRRTTR